MEKGGEIAQNEHFHLIPVKLLKMSNFTLFHNVFDAICPLIATFQLSSAASLNMGRSQNGVSGNGLNKTDLNGKI